MKQPLDMPVTPSEWREGVNAASTMLAVAIAQRYGLMRGGPVVDVEACTVMLKRGKRLGYLPRTEALDGYIRTLAGHLNREANEE